MKIALIGNPVSHSLSPSLHNFWCKKHGISGRYEAIALEQKDLDGFLERLRSGEFIGANVTAPLKEAAFKKVDRLGGVAKNTGAVNTILSDGGGVLQGRNTDPEGFIKNLVYQVPGFNFENTRAVIIGAGGAARACIYALLEKGAKDIVVVGRTESKLNSLIDSCASSQVRGISRDDLDSELTKTTLLVNATPKNPKVNMSLLSKEAVVYDLVYAPRETDFLKGAFSAGLKTVDGLGMLIRQAIPAFEAWFGVRPTFDVGIYDMLALVQQKGKS